MQVVEYSGALWRADFNYFREGGLASENYNGAKYKYFALSESELGSYTRRGMNKVKKWITSRPLQLIKMFDRDTRDIVYNRMDSRGKGAMDIAFPIDAEGNVYRVSEEDTTYADYMFLDLLCQMDIADGYIIPAQEPRPGVNSFHSEVGLCFAVFDSLRLENVKTTGIPALTRRKRNMSGRIIGNRRNNNTNGSSGTTRRRFNLNNVNNSSNNRQTIKRRRRFMNVAPNNTNKNRQHLKFPSFLNANNAPN